MYKVVCRFRDVKDSNYIYAVGDEFPREGASPSEKRIKLLASAKNKLGKPVIEKVSNGNRPVVEETVEENK